MNHANHAKLLQASHGVVIVNLQLYNAIYLSAKVVIVH